MDTLELLQSLGLELPTPAFIAGVILFSIVGMAAWWHGKKTQRPRIKWLGLALMLYAYVTPQTWLLYTVGFVLCAWLAWAYRSARG
jgi:hypothetical protein